MGSIDEGTVHSEQNVYTEYDDPKRNEWTTKIQPALKKLKLKVLEKECENKLSRREVIELRAGRSKPHRKTRELLELILKARFPLGDRVFRFSLDTLDVAQLFT